MILTITSSVSLDKSFYLCVCITILLHKVRNLNSMAYSSDTILCSYNFTWMHWIALQRRLSSIPLYRKIWDPNKLNNFPKDIAKWRQSQDMDLVLRFLRTVLSKNFRPPSAHSLLIETGMQYNRKKKKKEKTFQFTHFKKFIKLYICFTHSSVFLFYIII